MSGRLAACVCLVLACAGSERDRADHAATDAACGGDCLPRTVPAWPMPNPASTPLPNPARLRVADDVVDDEITGLVWQRRPGARGRWAAARDACARLVLAGQDDWRLPTRIELVSLIDFTRVPTIDAVAFPETPDDYFWTSSAHAGLPGQRWSVYFGLGEVAHEREDDDGAHVRCVRRGHRRAGPRFSVEPAVVRDRLTGLRWQRGVDPAAVTWPAASLLCEALVLDAPGPWRLPTVKELQTLVDEERWRPAIDPGAFPATPAGPFWSWSPDGEQRAVAVDFTDGEALTMEKGGTAMVRCVR